MHVFRIVCEDDKQPPTVVETDIHWIKAAVDRARHWDKEHDEHRHRIQHSDWVTLP